MAWRPPSGTFDIEQVMARLARMRPVFHNEADFQHAFAWETDELYPSTEVRLETRPLPGIAWFLDVALVIDRVRIAVELKYLTRRLEVVVKGEDFSLQNHSAHDTRRYDVVKDVVRLEQIIASGAADYGLAVVLSNDPAYWREWQATAVADAAFRIHHGRFLSGDAAWSARAGAGTTAGRVDPLNIRGEYALEWRDYSRIADGTAGSLRYMAVAVAPLEASPVDER